MNYQIGKRWTFEAAHHLDNVPASHRCARPHGHGYTIEIILAWDGDISARGWIVDYGDLDVIGSLLASEFDHRDLNEIFQTLDWNLPTTAEALAFVLWQEIHQRFPQLRPYLSAIRVSETAKTWAEVHP